MRIIGGSHRGKALLSPEDLSIRPTADRTREALFNILMHGNFPLEPIIDQPVLDLCCGSGALGLEAISRGAVHCTFIDQSKAALALAEANAKKLGELARCQFVLGDALKLPPAKQPVALVMMDAPYRSGLAERALVQLHEKGWLQPGSLIAVEQDKKETLDTPEGFSQHSNRHYGKAQITLLVAEQVGLSRRD